MNDARTNGAGEQLPAWLNRLLPLLSLVLGAAALWYTWYRYEDSVTTGLLWYEWIRLAFTLAIGVLCLAATPLLLLGRPAGRSAFKAGLTLVPAMLAVNLIILIVRVAASIATGQAQPFLERLFSEPRGLILPIVVIALVVLGSISKKNSNAGK